jgi:hypothetical protein
MILKIKWPIILTYSFLVIVLMIFFKDPSQAFIRETVYLLYPLLPVLAVVYACLVFGIKDKSSRLLLIIGIGFLCWFAGDVIWYVEKNFLNTNLFPSIADVFFLLGYPLILIGICLEYSWHKVPLKNINKRLFIAYSACVVLLSILVAYFGVYKAFIPNDNLLNNIIAMAYGVGDLIIIVASFLTMIIAYEYRGGAFGRFWIALTLGFIFSMIGDILFGVFRDQYLNAELPYVYLALLFVMRYIMFAYGIFDNSESIDKINRKMQKALIENK